jgi:predicted small lipoprotein YifL
MNLIKQKTLLFSLLTAISTLTACGLSGDLYQTPDSAKGEGIVMDENTDKKADNSEKSIEKPENKK